MQQLQRIENIYHFHFLDLFAFLFLSSLDDQYMNYNGWNLLYDICNASFACWVGGGSVG